jgi:hypothetical protein
MSGAESVQVGEQYLAPTCQGARNQLFGEARRTKQTECSVGGVVTASRKEVAEVFKPTQLG